MNLSITASNIVARDTQTALYRIDERNKQIVKQNAVLAAQIPPGTPLPLLPFATGAQIKASYEGLLVEAALALHENWKADEAAANGPNAQSFKDAFSTATPAQRTAALTALTS